MCIFNKFLILNPVNKEVKAHNETIQTSEQKAELKAAEIKKTHKDKASEKKK